MNQKFVDFDEVQQCQGVSNVKKIKTKKKLIIVFFFNACRCQNIRVCIQKQGKKLLGKNGEKQKNSNSGGKNLNIFR
jgi:hypothetical protein